MQLPVVDVKAAKDKVKELVSCQRAHHTNSQHKLVKRQSVVLVRIGNIKHNFVAQVPASRHKLEGQE